MTVIFPNHGCVQSIQDIPSNNDTLHATNNGDVGKQLRKHAAMADNQRNGMVPSTGPIWHSVLTSYDREELRVQNAFMLETLYEELKVFANKLLEFSVPIVLIIVLFRNIT